MTDDFLHLGGSFVTNLPFLKVVLVSSINFPSFSPAYHVSISGTTVILTCSQHLGSEVQWQHNGKNKEDSGDRLFLPEFSEMEQSGYYVCYPRGSNPEDASHHLYLKARGNPGLQSRHHRLFREDHSKGHSQWFPLTQLTVPWCLCASSHTQSRDSLVPHSISVFWNID